MYLHKTVYSRLEDSHDDFWTEPSSLKKPESMAYAKHVLFLTLQLSHLCNLDGLKELANGLKRKQTTEVQMDLRAEGWTETLATSGLLTR